jgi:hypothetical protein
MMKPLLSALAAALGLASGVAQAQSQGVSKDEILVGVMSRSLLNRER